MTNRHKAALQGAQIVVAADGCRNIPSAISVHLVRELFKDIGVDRLRAHRSGMQLSFEDVGELADADLGEAIAAGLDYVNSEPKAQWSLAKASMVARIEAQLGSLSERIRFRVGTMIIQWPKLPENIQY